MKFKGTLRSIRIDMRGYRDKLHAHLSEQIAHAAFLWLNAVLAQIPVWSGASHATFLRLARAVGYELAIQPRVISRIPYGQRHGDGEVVTDPGKGEYAFRFETSLAYLIYNEYNSANVTPDPTLFAKLLQPGPYGFQQVGVKVFQEFAKTVRLPIPWDNLKIKVHRI